MKIFYSPHFQRSFKNFTLEIQEKFKKQASYLLKNLRHPSLHAKKYDETKNVWQARVDKNIRFYFKIEKETYLLLEIKQHSR